MVPGPRRGPKCAVIVFDHPELCHGGRGSRGGVADIFCLSRPTSHLLCLLRPNKKQRGTHYSQADTHTETDGRGPDMLVELERGRLDRLLWPHWGSIDRLLPLLLSSPSCTLTAFQGLTGFHVHFGDHYEDAYLQRVTSEPLIKKRKKKKPLLK